MRPDRRVFLAVRALAVAKVAISLVGTTAPAWAGTTKLVSIGPHGTPANNESFSPSISADGRFVAFGSSATNLVPGDNAGSGCSKPPCPDVFVHDQPKGTMEAVGTGNTGLRESILSISANGRFVAFISDVESSTGCATGPDCIEVFVFDRLKGTTEPVSVGPRGRLANGDCFSPSISAGGRFVAFASGATNLVPDDTNGAFDVFVRDRKLGRTERVSVGPYGRQATGDTVGSHSPSISADGRFVACESYADNLVPGDTNGVVDVFVHDRQTGRTERVSVSSRDVQGDSDSGAGGLSISADGRFVAFASAATNLVPGDTNGEDDIFVRDRKLGRTERISIGPHGRQADFVSRTPPISANGRFVAFESFADDLVPGDTNQVLDIFVRDRRAGRTDLVSLSSRNRLGDDAIVSPVISADGRFVAFVSDADNLVPGDTNGRTDVFVRRR